MNDPDKRNQNNATFNVRVYFTSNAEHNFTAKDQRNAREIAKRICTEGVWVVNDDSEEFYPITQVYKCKIIRIQRKENP